MKSKFDSGSGGCELGAGNHGRVSPLAASIASGTQGPGTGTPSDIITSTHEEQGRRGADTHNQKRSYNIMLRDKTSQLKTFYDVSPSCKVL